MPNTRSGQPKLPKRLPEHPTGVKPADTPRLTQRPTRNLRALSVAPVDEEMPNLLPFDSSRVSEAGWSSKSHTLYVRFADGTPWQYDGVPQNVWRNFRRSASPGKFINRVLNNFNYHRSSF